MEKKKKSKTKKTLITLLLTAIGAISLYFCINAHNKTEGILNFLLILCILIVSAGMLQWRETKEVEKKLRDATENDELTKLHNRKRLYEAGQHYLENVIAKNEFMPLFFIDIDRFKVINDSLGSDIGDEILIKFSERLKEFTMEKGFVARHSGDKFVLLYQIEKEEKLEGIADKLFESLTTPYHIRGQEIFITTSIGISVSPNDGDQIERLVQYAEKMMHKVKRQGKNNYKVYNKATGTVDPRTFALETGLRKALERNEFLLYFQPQIDIKTGSIISCESLIRWQHPEFGLVSPGEFLPILEESGLIVQVGEWVLREACLKSKKWQKMGLKPIRIAVNFSAYQFLQEDVVEMIKEILEETELNPQLLEVEITESVIIQDVEEVIKRLQQLKDMGIHISIDDFGTGYSSFSYLKRLPVDTIKMDRFFIKDIGTNKNDEAITKAILALANMLNLKSIAEGVETKEQMKFLEEAGCEVIQGYLISKPLPSEQFEGMIVEEKNK